MRHPLSMVSQILVVSVLSCWPEIEFGVVYFHDLDAGANRHLRCTVKKTAEVAQLHTQRPGCRHPCRGAEVGPAEIVGGGRHRRLCLQNPRHPCSSWDPAKKLRQSLRSTPLIRTRGHVCIRHLIQLSSIWLQHPPRRTRHQ